MRARSALRKKNPIMRSSNTLSINVLTIALNSGFAAELFKKTLAIEDGSAFGSFGRNAYSENDYIIPSWRRAASDILLGSHGGSHTRSSFTSVTPDTALTLFSISAGNDCTAGQCGDVSVILIDTTPSALNLHLIHQSQLVDVNGDLGVIAGTQVPLRPALP